MNVCEDSYNSDRGMFFLIHNMKNQSNKQFREDFKDLLRFKVFSRVGHNH